MAEPLPEHSHETEAAQPDRRPVRRPTWVIAVIVGVVLLVAVVAVLHLTGNSPGGPGSHLP